ncbi:MAG: BlaI/MecI/CopY family transcriptional regulator [Acidobacteriia bacterium]|nr:BlaI/MecI/CopY family transcriptional regulator [Terriglobia bacterium]
MHRTPRDMPPPLEMLCLKALWSLGEANVREVQTVVAQSRPLAYTTIMTVLERLVRKGRLGRRKAGRAFVYSLQASREAMRRAAIRELVDGFFDGSEADLVRFLSGSETAAVADAGVPDPPAPVPEATIDTVLL